MLSRLVESGDLSPIEDRLPDTPLIVEPVERPGTYGGDMRSAILGPAEAIQLNRIVGYEGLVRWTPDWADQVVPNIAESFVASEDALEVTVTLRKGMKWSDGQPFTVDDLLFAQNDVLNNPELYPTQGGNPVAEKVDAHTVRFTFEKPNGLYLQEQATVGGTDLVRRPRHHLEQFHKDHNPDIDALVEEEGAADWVELFQAKSDLWVNKLPTLNAWQVATAVGETSRVVLERNPYYWKTDPDGRQLPYTDRVVYDLIADPEVILLNSGNGDIDFQLRPVNTLSNKPMLSRGADSGGYRLFDAIPSNMNTIALSLNLVHKDEEMRAVFRERDFRIGLSHAINRQEIIDTVYQRQGEPFQCAPRPESDLYDETLAKQYTDYSVETANEHLDRVLPDKDGDGYRVLPSGQRLRITVEFALGIWPDYPPTLDLIKGYWDAVGVEMTPQGHDRSLFTERTDVSANEYDAVLWQGDGGHGDLFLSPHYYFPRSVNAYYARAWGLWYSSGGEAGEEPPESAQQQTEIYDQLLTTVDLDERADLMRQILEIAREEFWVMGINLQPDEYGLANNRLRNVPDSMPNSWLYPTPGPTNPEQYFIEE